MNSQLHERFGVVGMSLGEAHSDFMNGTTAGVESVSSETSLGVMTSSIEGSSFWDVLGGSGGLGLN